jgi:PAS domain S-box-containing protein
MHLSENLFDLLKEFSPAQLREAAIALRAIRDQKSSKGPYLEAGLGAVVPTSYSALHRMDLSIDPNTLEVVACNQASWDTLGAQPLGKHLPDLIDPEYLEAVERALESLRRQKEIKQVRLRFAFADKDCVPVLMTANWIDDNDQGVALIHILCRDVTSLQQIGNIEIFSEMLSIGIVLVDEDGRIAFANSSAEKMFDYGPCELENQPFEMVLPEVLRDTHVKDTAIFFDKPMAKRELHGRRKDGTGIALQVSLSSIRLGQRNFMVTGIADLTERKSMERFVSLREEQRALIFSNGLAGDFIWNLERDEVEAHPTVFKLYGSEPITGAVPAAWFRAHHPGDDAHNEGKWLDLFATARQPSLEFEVKGDDGVTRWLECHEVTVRDVAGQPRQVYGVFVDITARKRSEEQLKGAVREKEVMLREIHHRVKNNLQIISSLLSLQAATAGENAPALRDSERRLSTIAMIHEQLYATGDMQTLDFADHARTLSQSLLASMVQGPRISVRFDMKPVDLTINQAIPCALILNELLTNALKYAYPNEQKGEITIHLSCVEERITLTVSDEGVGLPSQFPRKSNTLGLEIVQVLANQLEGELIVVGSPGASFSVRFRRQNHVNGSAAAHSAAAASPG